MLTAQIIYDFVEKKLEGSDLFLVDVKLSPSTIEIEVDSDEPVSIEECEKLSHALENEFDPEIGEYNLEVGSAGLTSPFKVKRQYRKYIGREVEVILADGKKLSGLLTNAGDNNFTVVTKEKIKKDGAKRPVVEDVEHVLNYDEVKQTKYLLKF